MTKRQLKRGTVQEPVSVIAPAPVLKRVILKDFQAHKYTTLDLSPGVNAITGQSDSGKTSIKRDISWVATNRPSGLETFLRTGADPNAGVQGALVFADGVSIGRVQSKKENTYELKTPLTDLHFAAVGTSVPEQVKTALNLSDVNIQSQFDAHFMLSSSPGEVGRMLNEVTGLDMIDSLFQHINGIATTTKADGTRLELEIGKAHASLAALEFLDDAGHLLNDARTSAAVADALEQEAHALLKLIQHGQLIQERIASLGPVLQVGADLDAIEVLARFADDRTRSAENLLEQIRWARTIASEKKRIGKVLAADADLTALEIQLKKVEIMQDNVTRLDKFIVAMKYLSTELTTATDQVTQSSRELADLLTKHGVCPLCLQKVPAHMIFNW
jgi:exonuclease SbcC